MANIMANITGTTIKNKNKRLKYQILALIMGLMFLCSIVCLAAYLWGLQRAETDMEAVRASYVSQPGDVPDEEASGGQKEPKNGEAAIPQESSEEEKSAENGSPEAEGASAPNVKHPDYGIGEKSVDIAALQEEVNEDIYAWINVPGTDIDYPVLQHPEEMDYYLNHNLDRSKGYPGSIYSQRVNVKDWTDPNTVLYGHNMKKGTMFAGLHKFEDKDFFNENRYIHIYTEDGVILIYEIFAAYETDDRHQLMIWNLNTEEGFQSYLDAIQEQSGQGCNLKEEIKPTTEDKILTLSTCVDDLQRGDRRYLVQGVLIDREERP